MSRVAVVTDERVARLHAPRYLAGLHARGFAATAFAVAEGEAAKTLSEAERLLGALVGAGLDRGGVVVALGGGAASDLAGFVAATLFRGVALAQVPTTLLAMVDASVGGKNGVNLAAGKNLAGTIHQPALVFADLATLATLPARDLAAGCGEIVKHALLDGEAALAALEEAADRVRAGDPATLAGLVAASVRLKARVVSADERELDPEGGRSLLNLGHTVGHALEAESLQGAAPLRHGEAVALGLLAAARVGARLDPRAAAARLEERLGRLLPRLGLPADLDGALARLPAALARLGVDKKRAGGAIRYVALPAPGAARITRLEPARLQTLVEPALASVNESAPEARP
jgi:shikimate kinase/3-dehydroquinate synthase